MKKKIVALMMVVPLILMLTIFAISKTVTVSVDIPAENIQIVSQNDEGFVSFDMATYKDDYVVQAKVFPEQAKNKKFNVEIKSLDNIEDPCISVNEDNILLLNRVGLAELTVISNDKGFTDSMKISVNSSKAYDLNVKLEEGTLTESLDPNYDYQYETTTGGDLKFVSNVVPQNIIENDVAFSCDDKSLLVNKYSGVVHKIFSGEYNLKVSIPDGIKGPITKSIKLIVNKPYNKTLVNGQDSPLVKMIPDTDEITFFVETEDVLYQEDIECINAKDITINTIKDNKYSVTLKLNNKIIKDEKIPVKIKELDFYIEAKDCLRNIVTNYDRKVGSRTILQRNGVVTRYSTIVDPIINADFKWSVDSDIVELREIPDSLNNKDVDIVAKNEGVCNLTLTIKINDKEYVDTYKIQVISNVSNPSFSRLNNYGIKKIYTYGDIDLSNDTYSKVDNVLSLIDGNKNEIDLKNFDITVNDNSILTINENGNIEILKDGCVDVTANWKYNDYFNENILATTKVCVVKDGVNVSDSRSLLKATEEGKKIVLKENIEFAKDFTDEEITNLLANHQIYTTFDWQYYTNNGKERPKVKYILEFKNDLYGNGYAIDCSNITMPNGDPTNHKYFKGPLNFVSVGNRAAVKGQDNICFLVRNNNIKIDNVKLQAIKDGLLNEEIDGTQKTNLSRLNYVGTTLEVMGNNVKIVNSRISNGRNVLRIYSGNDDNNVIVDIPITNFQVKKEKINVVVDSCILSKAREFIVKIGSNRAIKCKKELNKEYEQAYLLDKTNKPFEYLNKIFDAYNDEFNNKYVLTDVTLKDSILDTSGLFSIGMETHFAGPFLLGEGGDLSDTLKSFKWEKLAATSYAAVLRLVGDVRLYDWKNVNNVDSSTLIETNGDTVGNGQLAEIVKLDIKAMINKVSKEPGFENIVSTIDENNYVHGGIAFYGGGRNYSKIDMTNFTGEEFNKYNININILAKGADITSGEGLQGNMLPLAAGTEDFTFFMYDKTNKFNYSQQQKELDNGSAYSWIKGVL